jgi:hypothetical protein
MVERRVGSHPVLVRPVFHGLGGDCAAIIILQCQDILVSFALKHRKSYCEVAIYFAYIH